jgi:hypothetical protein
MLIVPAVPVSYHIFLDFNHSSLAVKGVAGICLHLASMMDEILHKLCHCTSVKYHTSFKRCL